MSVNSHHPRYAQQLLDWEQMRHTYEGERTVKEEGTRYLPATSGMVADGFTNLAATNSVGYLAYRAYRARATFPEYVREAVQSMVGIINSKPPVIELPAALEQMRERATLANESLEMLLRRMNEEQLISGRVGLLLDVPSLPATSSVPLTPYIATYVAESIINWDAGERDRPLPEALNLVVLNETEEVRVGNGFEWENKERYRVLILGDLIANEGTEDGDGSPAASTGEPVYRVGVFHEGNAAFSEDGMVEPAVRGVRLSRIPFVFANTKDIVSDPDRPPLLGLSNLALTIYRGEADYRQALFMQGQDTLVVIGGSADENTVYRTGAGAAITVPIGGDAKYIGVSSQGLAEMRSALENDHERAKGKAGELVNESSRERESGDALRIRVAARTTTLRSIATTAAFALQEILRIAATWVGANPDEVMVTPNLEFIDQSMTGKDLLDLMGAKNLGAPISLESIHNTMRARGMTEKEFEEEVQAIEDEQDLELTPKPSTEDGGPEADGQAPAADDTDDAEDDTQDDSEDMA
jgi:hypothetical protein